MASGGSFSDEQWLSIGGNLTMSGDSLMVTTWGWGLRWYLVGGGRGCCEMQRTAPVAGGHVAQNASGGEAEKHCRGEGRKQ